MKILFITLFYIYLVDVASHTLFPIFFRVIPFPQNVWKTMNLVPIATLSFKDVKTCALNVLLFVPFGYLLPLVKTVRVRSVIASGFITSICIELLQLVTGLIAGFTFRIVDINDVIFNSVGTILGYTLFLLFARIFQLLFQRWNLERNAILDYIDKQTKY